MAAGDTREADPTPRSVAADFARAHAALEAEIARAEPHDPLVFYRLRDVALAARAFAELLFEGAGVRIAPHGELATALAALAPLANSHVLAFLHAPPTRVVEQGRAAAALVSSLLDAIVGDGFVARGAP